MENWTKTVSVSDVPANCLVTIQKDGIELIIYQTEGEYYVYPNRCTHQDVPLSDGYLVNDAVICRLHGAKFDLKTGDCLRAPARGNLRGYDVSVRDGYLFIRRSEVGERAAYPAPVTIRSFRDAQVCVNA